MTWRFCGCLFHIVAVFCLLIEGWRIKIDCSVVCAFFLAIHVIIFFLIIFFIFSLFCLQEVMMHNAQKEIVERIIEKEVVRVRTFPLLLVISLFSAFSCAILCAFRATSSYFMATSPLLFHENIPFNTSFIHSFHVGNYCRR